MPDGTELIEYGAYSEWPSRTDDESYEITI